MVIEPLTPERRRQQTRDALITAAAQVFAERGFHGASLDEVAAVAGFTKGAVYSNFKGKDDLFVAVLESRYRRNLEALQTTLDESGNHPENLAGWVERQHKEEGGPWGTLIQEFTLYAMRHPSAKAKLAALQRSDIDALTHLITAERKIHGTEMPEPPEHQARIVTALFQGLSEMRAVDPEAVDASLLESVMSFVTRAMMPTD
jgi:AcrR family transcriptional regulator